MRLIRVVQFLIIMWSDKLNLTGVNKDTNLNTAELDQNLMHIMGLKDKSSSNHSYWLDQDYRFTPEVNWPYWENKS